jgi:tetratricopeptide (TPR) repeat protein
VPDGRRAPAKVAVVAIDSSRIVEVWCPESEKGVGTGFRVTGSHVLTARHVINVQKADIAASAEVRLFESQAAHPWVPAEVCWVSTTHDLALLEVGDATWETADVVPVRLGELVGEGMIRVDALGFPDVAEGPDHRRDTWPLHGHLDPQHEIRRFKSGAATIHVDESIIPAEHDSWAGMSGAAVFNHETGHLVGVVKASYSVAADPRVLHATLATADPELLLRVAKLGITTEPAIRRSTVPTYFKYPSRGFIDGRRQLKAIAATLDATEDPGRPGVAILAGMSGLGKSRLAEQFLYHYPERRYDVVRRIEATSESVDDRLKLFAQDLEIPPADSPAELCAAIWRKLAECRRWLLVFDNARPETLLRRREDHNRWPACPNGDVIVTSDRMAWEQFHESVLRLDVMSPDDAVDLLWARSGLPEDQRDRDIAVDTVAKLGYLPVYVELASHWIEQNGRGALTRYHEHLLENLSLLSGRRQSRSEMDTTGAAGWMTSFQDMREREDDYGRPVGRDAATLLRLLAYFGPDDIPREIVEQQAGQATGRTRSVLSDSLRMDRAIGLLAEYAFVQRTDERNSLRLHSLIQETTRAQLREQDPSLATECSGTAVRILEAAFPQDPDDPATWPDCSLLYPHARVAVRHAQQFGAGIATRECVRLLHKCGQYLHSQSRVKDAEDVLRSALTMLRDPAADEAWPATAAELLVTLSGVLHTFEGHLSEARTAAEDAIAIYEKTGRQISPELAHALTVLSSACRELQDFPAALHAEQRALGIVSVVCGQDSAEFAEALDYLGRILWRMGNLQSARTTLERLRAIAGNGTDAESRKRLAFADRYLGLIARDGGDYQLAKLRLEESLQIFSEVVGPEHRDALKSECLLAGVLVDSGRTTPHDADRARDFRRAEEHLDHVYEELPKQLSPRHGDMAEFYVLRSALRRRTGRAEAARDDLTEAYEVFAGSHGDEQPYVGHVYLRRAPVMAALGELEQAEEDFRHALRLYRAGFGERHPYVADVYLEMAELRQAQLRMSDAEELRAEASAMRSRANAS